MSRKVAIVHYNRHDWKFPSEFRQADNCKFPTAETVGAEKVKLYP